MKREPLALLYAEHAADRRARITSNDQAIRPHDRRNYPRRDRENSDL